MRIAVCSEGISSKTAVRPVTAISAHMAPAAASPTAISKAPRRSRSAAYLLYIAVRLWRSHAGPKPTVAVSERAAQPARQALLRGLATGLLNPKSLAYFGSIFVLLVPADAGWPLRTAAVGLVLFDALLWYGLAACLFSTPRVIEGYMTLRRPIDRACAALMAAFGVKLML